MSTNTPNAYSADDFKTLKGEFKKVTKRVLKKNISKNPEKLEEYETDLIKTYNDIITYVAHYYNDLDQNIQETIRTDLLRLRDNLASSFQKLNLRVKLPARLIEKIRDLEPLSDVEDDADNMPDQISVTDFLRLAANTINRNFSGDPLALNAFINSINLLKTIADATHEALLRQFILSKLEGRALEAVPQNVNSIDEIITALKSTIKPDNSKVISGRMMALRADRVSMQDFTKQAEDLADAFKRSLVVEGISQSKAKEMAIEKTIEMCRTSAKTDLVKSILAATSFTDPKEVVAKFVVESTSENKEKHVLAYGSNDFRNRKRGNNSYRGKGRNFNNSGRNFNRNYNNNGNYNGNNGYRGKRRYNNDRGRGYNNNNNRYVRFTENSDAPSQERRGEMPQENAIYGNQVNNRSQYQYTA